MSFSASLKDFFLQLTTPFRSCLWPSWFSYSQSRLLNLRNRPSSTTTEDPLLERRVNTLRYWLWK